MRELAELYTDAYADGVDIIFDYPIGFAKAATIEFGGKYGIFIDASATQNQTEELCILAHECGHFYTGATHKLYSPFTLIEQNEYKANRWAVHRLLPAATLCTALEEGCCEVWELAERFDLTEDFIRTALRVYRAEEKLPRAS